MLRNVLNRLRARRETAAIRDLPDRRLMADVYIPALAARGGTILWVGARAYTVQDYGALERQGAVVWTTDIDPKAARWGRHGRHRTGDLCDIDRVFPDITFDAIVCNGVFGFGVDTPEMQARAYAAMANVLKPKGLLLLGWNTDKTSDPVADSLPQAWFKSVDFAGVGARTTFTDVTHVYDIFKREPSR